MNKFSPKIDKIYTFMKEFQEVVGYFVKTLWRASKPLTIILFLLSLGGGLTLIAELWAITSLINQLIENDPSQIDLMTTMQVLLPWVLLFIGAMLIKHSFEAYQPYIAKLLEEKASVIIKDQIFRRALSLDLRSFETEEYYNQLENANRAINNRFTMMLETVGLFIASILELVVIIVAVSQSGTIYSILLIVGFIILSFIAMKSGKEFTKVNYQQSPLKRQQGYWIGLSTSRQTAAELRLFGLGSYFLGKWQSLTKQVIDELSQGRKRIASLRVRGDLMMILLLSMLIIGIVSAGIKGTITVGALVALLYMINRFENAAHGVVWQLESLSEFYVSLQYIPNFLKSGEEEITTGHKAPTSINKGIVFENVSFTYPGSSRQSLENIDLHIEPGERIAIVGENGAGKSTLALLLLGLYRPTKGRILIDGVDLATITPSTWRKKAAAVFQNFVKYQLSAKENITFGNVSAMNDGVKLKQVAKQSGIDDVLSQLPDGYETLLGREYEKSKDLSGGEWQKVAIARAYFKEAAILVLDEPAASLDAQSEYKVYKQFSQVSEGKTTMLISHRLGSARLADRIVLLQAGQLVEAGSHEELIAQSGRYATLYHSQAEWYQRGEEG